MGRKNNFMHFKPRQKKRLFIGIPITDELKNKLENGIQQNISLPFYRWVPKENYHVTTLFLGSVNEKEIDQIRETIQEIFHGRFLKNKVDFFFIYIIILNGNS